MAQDQGSELPSSDRPFRLSDYRDGTFQPNGTFTRESILSPEAIDFWQKDNNEFWQGKAWGRGQALFFRDRPILFGRDHNSIDVKVDADPNPQGSSLVELGVSRRHFTLNLPQDKKILIQDMGSTNGVTILTKEGKIKTELNKSNPQTLLEVGDFTLFGGGDIHNPKNPEGLPNTHSRLIGFRVCEDSTGKLFLVKFNAKSIDDLLALTGRTRADYPTKTFEDLEPEENKISTSNESIERTPAIEAVKKAFTTLLTDFAHLKIKIETPTSANPDVLILYQKLFIDLFTLSQEIGDKYYKGDWSTAAAMVSREAINESSRLLREGNNKEAKVNADLAHFIINFSTGKLITFT